MEVRRVGSGQRLLSQCPHYWRINIQGDYLSSLRAENRSDRTSKARPRSLFDPCLGGCPLQDCERERERAGGVAWSAHGTVSDAGQCAPRQPSKQKRVKESLSTDSRLLLGLLCAVCERQRGAGHAIGGWCVATKIVSGGAVVDAYGCSGRRAPAPASACC